MKIVFALIMLFLFSACTNQDKPEKKSLVVSASSITNSGLSSEQKAEQLTKAAEELLSADGFLQAHEFVTLALQHNPHNLKANFLKVFLDPLILLKGYYIRIQPLIGKSKKSQEDYEKELNKLKEEASHSGLARHYLNGKPDLKTEKEAQVYLDALLESVEALRLFVQKNKSSDLTFQANSLFLQNELTDRYVEACEIKALEDTLSYEIICPDTKVRSEIVINRADFELLQHMAALQFMIFSFSNAYDISGMVQVGDEKDENPSMTGQVLYEKLIKNKNFGVLRNKNYLKKVQTLGLEILSGIDWVTSNQSTLCPAGIEKPQRMGMLFYKGVCLDPASGTYIKEALLPILEAKAVKMQLSNNGQPYETELNYGQALINPIKDIRSLGILKVDNCRNIESVEDSTMGGIFPKKDANIALPLFNKKCDL